MALAICWVIRLKILNRCNGNLQTVTNYNRFGEEIFADTYEFEATDEKVFNHGIMRLLYSPHELTNNFI